MHTSEMDISIVSIGEVGAMTRLHRWELLRYGNTLTDIDVGLTARIDETDRPDRLRLRLTVLYTYMRTMIRRPLLQYTVECVFEIRQMDTRLLFDESRLRVDLPVEVLSLMLSVAIGALRGMVANKCHDTPLADRPLPLINISTLVGKLHYRHSNAPEPVDTL